MNGSGPGAISQTFDTIAGFTYTVTFAMAGNPFPDFGGGPIKTMSVSADGDSDVYNFDRTGRSPTDMGWTDMVFSFVADDSSATLTFTSLTIDTCCTGPALDNVRVLATPPDTPAVPEPATIAIIAVGLLGLAGARRLAA